jgi:hypothetical protein
MSSGVIVFQGMKVGVLPGDLQISVDDAGVLQSKLVLSTAYNVLPIWLRIADDQFKQARSAHESLTRDWGQSEAGNRELLMRELEPSLQVFVACGIALDAIYDLLKPYAKLDQPTLEAWKRNGTSRATQIFEVIRRVYRLDKVNSDGFKKHIEQIINLRDQAVHPSLELRRTCTRPDIPVGVDWKFSAYRYDNASICFQATMNMLIHVYEKRSGVDDLDSQMDNVFNALEELKVISRKTPEVPSSDASHRA